MDIDGKCYVLSIVRRMRIEVDFKGDLKEFI